MDWWKKKKKQRLIRSRERGAILLKDLIECCDGESNPIKFFSADQIIKATDNFFCGYISPSLWSSVEFYSGNIDNHRMILVKRFYKYSSFYEVARDITISSMVSGHKNFMRLGGCCLEFEDPIMVYYGEKRHCVPLDLNMVVSWRRRMTIAADIATALAYLHTAFVRPFVYRVMNLRHILLDENGIAKLIHFSYCVSIPEGETFVQLDATAGIAKLINHDYIDHDYLMNGIVSEKTDAYGFGILILQLLTGEDISVWRRSIAEGEMREIVDPKILKEIGELAEEERFQMEAFIVIAERCIGLRGEVPKMVEVAKELKTFLKNASTNC